MQIHHSACYFKILQYFVTSNNYNSRADLCNNCAFYDRSMKLGTWFLDIMRSNLSSGAASSLTFCDL